MQEVNLPIVFCLLVCLTMGVDGRNYKCATSLHQVMGSQLCDSASNCPDGSDEAKAFCDLWNHPNCAKGQAPCDDPYRSYVDCKDWRYNCDTYQCGYKLNSTMCEAIKSYKIPRFAGPPDSVLSTPVPTPPPAVTSDDITSFLTVVGDQIHSNSSSSGACPVFYNNISNHCIAFLPFKLTWPEALEACASLDGSLAEVSDFGLYFDLVSHVQKIGFTSEFWIGGFYDITADEWMWESGNKMTMGTPFWMIRHQTACSPRVITDKLGPSADCYHYHQAPSESVAGQCASLDYKSMYFINNEPCTEKRRPICLYKKWENLNLSENIILKE